GPRSLDEDSDWGLPACPGPAADARPLARDAGRREASHTAIRPAYPTRSHKASVETGPARRVPRRRSPIIATRRDLPTDPATLREAVHRRSGQPPPRLGASRDTLRPPWGLFAD